MTNEYKIKIAEYKFDTLHALHKGTVIALCKDECGEDSCEGCDGFGVMCQCCKNEYPCLTAKILGGLVTREEALEEIQKEWNYEQL